MITPHLPTFISDAKELIDAGMNSVDAVTRVVTDGFPNSNDPEYATAWQCWVAQLPPEFTSDMAILNDPHEWVFRFQDGDSMTGVLADSVKARAAMAVMAGLGISAG